MQILVDFLLLGIYQYLLLSSNATPARKTNALGITGTICDQSDRVGKGDNNLLNTPYHRINKQILGKHPLATLSCAWNGKSFTVNIDREIVVTMKDCDDLSGSSHGR